MNPPSSPVDQKALQELFHKLDRNHDGQLTLSEFEQAAHELKLPSRHLLKIFQQIDTNHDQSITFEEFSTFLTHRYDELKLIFQQLDTNHDGKLDANEMMQGIQKVYKLGGAGAGGDTSRNTVTDQQFVQKLLNRMDVNRDAEISFEEFRDMLCLVPEVTLESVVEYWREASALLSDDVDLVLVSGKNLQEQAAVSLRGPFSFLNNASKAVLAGGLAGAISKTVTAPMERLKVIYQVQTKKPPSMWMGLKEIYTEGGVKGLFRGNGVNIIKSAPEKAIKYAAFEQVKSMLTKMNGGESSNVITFIAGSSSGVICHTALYPLEVVKTRLSVAPTGEYNGMFDAIFKIAKNEGPIKPFFRGLVPNILNTIWTSGFSLMTYDAMKQVLVNHSPNGQPSIGGLMFCGSASSVLSQTLFYPLHVVKTRMIMQGAHELVVTKKNLKANVHGQVATATTYTGMMDAFVKIIQQEGTKALFKGFVPSMMKGIPAHGVTFGVYELVKRYLGFEEAGHKKH
ncbi:hypothetical protein C9374_001046 [Naegleria lovaniensis]|uniref:EF-hand domain-containing protein n=1 Tax=Naegleria lovaniensis TaxID=51637 RepID=A0AA88KP11_NAELO|nr:uncharacterized protein C9374_001046 [Naegleria lovaniensis]KAG2388196.1 hypothetical protein C9374_001046 [Naegleria lovaniensis]